MESASSSPCDKTTLSKDVHAIQMRYRLSPATMKIISSIPRAPDRQQILHKACLASELRSFPLRQAERGFFRDVNDHTAIPYTVKEALTQPWHKVFLLIQVELLRTGWPNKVSATARKELYQDLGKMLLLLDRILRCMVDVLGARRDGRGINTALDVLRSVRSRVWEGEGRELLLVNGIGVAKLDKLGRAGIRTIRQLQQLDFCHIERLLSRNPPFGHQLLEQLAGFPHLVCHFESIERAASLQLAQENSFPSNLCSWICRAVMGYDNDRPPFWKTDNPWVTLVIGGDDGRLLWFWRGRVEKLRERKDLVISLQTRSGEEIELQLACEDIVGTMVRVKHQMP
ncbi:hypothetical protein E4U42_003921 [Claviceps africana]|uniref:SEC63 domain-containing protein n=1 Tax=Claviceps africana TaxID=83212 RepID=A0A8K0NL66_9HYPO|nr:hypothetical protein E4U42_003921 [Claviceps africana]